MTEEDPTECQICNRKYDDDKKFPMMIDCGHTFCLDSLNRIQNSRCPMCNTSFSRTSMRKNYAVLRICNLEESRRATFRIRPTPNPRVTPTPTTPSRPSQTPTIPSFFFFSQPNNETHFMGFRIHRVLKPKPTRREVTTF